MKIKRFSAPDMRRAIQLVRQEHGPDAVILSSRSVDGGIEIVSAVDYDPDLIAGMAGAAAAPAKPALPAQSAAQVELAASLARTEVGDPPEARSAAAPEGEVDARAAPAETPPVPRPVIEIDWTSDPSLKAMQAELSAVRGMLNEQFARLSWADLRAFRPARALLLRRVAALSLDEGLAATLVEEVAHPDDGTQAWREVLLGLARRLKVARQDPIEEGGVFALVGPTGVGKTTTIAKLAARHCLRHGAESLALISTDNFRVGAQRQLDAYGAILGVAVRRAETGDDLRRQLEELSDRRLVLIDTAGMAPRDRRLAESLGRLADAGNIRRMLVLSANMQLAVMRDAVRFFGGDNLAGITLTKLDESPGLGAALSILVETALPAVWLSEGQRVPEDLKLARVIHLLGWASDVEATDAPGRAPPAPFAHRPASFREVLNAGA